MEENIMHAHFANFGQLNATQKPIGKRLRSAIRTLATFLQEDEEFDSYEAQLRSTIELSGMVSPQYDSITLESWD
jgi:hypothetical protein